MKKKITYAFATLLVTQTLWNQQVIQDGYSWEFRSYWQENKIQDSLLKENNVTAVISFQKKEKGEKIIHEKLLINTSSNEKVELMGLSDKKLKTKSVQEINNYTIFSWNTYGQNKKQINQYELINGKRYLKEIQSYKKDKKDTRTVFFRNEKGLIDSTHYYTKNNSEVASKTLYKYEEDKLIESRYFRKGKLKSVKKFNCDPFGQKEKSVSTSQYCTNNEKDVDGNNIKITIYTDYKGNQYKTKETYYGETNKPMKYERFDSDNRLTSKQTYSDTLYTNYYYKKNGKTFFGQEKRYQNNLVVQEKGYHKDKLTSTINYSYIENGLLLETSKVQRKKNPITTVYTYEFE